MVEIVQNGHKALREIAEAIKIEDITKPKIQKILKEMSEALDSQYDGVAIAAPQIGVTLRIFLMSGKVFDEDFITGVRPAKDKIRIHPNVVFINPVIKKISKDKKLMAEGCLSVRPLYGKVRRATRVTVEAYNEHGKKFTMNGAGLIAHIFQHETDHLDGVLFIDKAKEIHESSPEDAY
jgi:peptide deformylase